MTQPTFVPITEADQVRPARHLHVPEAWTTGRPAELKTPIAPKGRSIGTPGSDAGFALRLAARFAHDLKLTEGETEHDVLLGSALIAARRAALFGRGPSIYDLQVALALFGFLVDDPPAELVGSPSSGLLLRLPRLRGTTKPGRRRPRREPPHDPRRGAGQARAGRSCPPGRGRAGCPRLIAFPGAERRYAGRGRTRSALRE